MERTVSRGQRARTALGVSLLLAIGLDAGCSSERSDPGPLDEVGQDVGDEAPDEVLLDTSPAEVPVDGAPGCAKPATSEQVWFAPNVGSVDLLDLFSLPDRWKLARARVHVFQLYAQELLADDAAGCPSCGPNVLPAFVARGAFDRLKEWKLELAIEGGAIKEWGCTADRTSPEVIRAIDRVVAAGGKVSYVAMDEPYAGGKISVGGKSCGQTMATSASETAKFIDAVHAAHPAVAIGDIEPYPFFRRAELEAWITEVEKNGAKLPFFHLDVDRNAVKGAKVDVAADMAALRTFVESRGIAFGVIYTSHEIGAPSDPTKLDEFFYGRVMDWLSVVKCSLGAPRHSIFQSWFSKDGKNVVPVNLPDDDPAVFSHTRLVRDGLAFLSGP